MHSKIQSWLSEVIGEEENVTVASGCFSCVSIASKVTSLDRGMFAVTER